MRMRGKQPARNVRKRVKAIWVFGLILWSLHVLHAKSENLQSKNEARGKQLYEFYCYQCHGYSGNADTVAARFLDPKPRNFSRSDPRVLTREKMLSAVRAGRPGTAMTSFSRVLTSEDMAAVIDYITAELMSEQRQDLRYHSAENGWSDHQRYEPAFDFVLGKIPVNTPWKRLSPRQRIGKELFLSACITCHEASASHPDPLQWSPRAVSYPRSTDTCLDCHAARPPELLPPTGAKRDSIGLTGESYLAPVDLASSPYLAHAQPQTDAPLSEAQTRGKALFLANCAFCHAADGSARNWIGSFLEPRPRDLRRNHFPGMTSGSDLIEVIRHGIPGTSMPAWKGALTERDIEDLVDFLEINTGRSPASVPNAAIQPLQGDRTVPKWIRRTGGPTRDD